MSAWTCRSIDGKAARKIVPPRPRIPYWKGLGADSEEKHEPASDVDTVVVDGLKALDPKRPIREAEHEAAEWQAAMEALILVATSGGPTMFARIGVMRALNRHVERVFNPDRKEHHWGRRKLARDR